MSPYLWLAGGIASVLLLRQSQSVDLDPFASYEPATGCDPTPKPGVLAFRDYWIARHGERPGSPQNIVRDCGVGGQSEHKEGRGWDWMLPRGLEHAQAAVDELTRDECAGARRMGIMYMILNRRMWRSYPFAGSAPGAWSAYTGPNPHTDHVHFSFSRAGAAGTTSFYTIV